MAEERMKYNMECVEHQNNLFEGIGDKAVVNESSQISNEYKLILTSRGLNTVDGVSLIHKVFSKELMKPSSIMLMTLPSYGIDDIIVKHCKEFGFIDIYKAEEFAGEELEDIPDVEYVYVTEGNTFEVVDYIRRNDFDKYIKKQVIRNGATYIGSSAGAIYASCSFKEAENFDNNSVGMKMFKGLMLMPHKNGIGYTVIPHYTYKQVQNYISSMDEIDKSQYTEMLSISNEEALVMDCKRVVDDSTEIVKLVKKRRIRI